MTDIEKLTQTFDALKIEYTISTAMEYDGKPTYTSKYDGECTWDTALQIENGVGYFSFICVFYFLNGQCTGHGVWE